MTRLAGTASLRNLFIEKKPAGELRVTAETKNGLLALSVAGEGAGMRLDGQARCKLQGDYAVEGEANFTKFALSNLRPWLLAAYGKDLPLEAVAEGKITFAGRAFDKSMSGAIGPSVFTPEIATFRAFHGLRIESVTAVASKPQWTMQSEHLA